MQTSYTYASALAASQRINWKVEDIIGGGKRLDFDKPFMPEALARVSALDLPAREKIGRASCRERV